MHGVKESLINLQNALTQIKVKFQILKSITIMERICHHYSLKILILVRLILKKIIHKMLAITQTITIYQISTDI